MTCGVGMSASERVSVRAGRVVGPTRSTGSHERATRVSERARERACG
jgi:hypothetical protein